MIVGYCLYCEKSQTTTEYKIDEAPSGLLILRAWCPDCKEQLADAEISLGMEIINGPQGS